MNAAMILSGGAGLRSGGDIPKQYRALLGREVIAYSVDAFRQSGAGALVIVCGDGFSGELERKYGVPAVTGGETRNASLKNGLDYIRRQYPECEKILINEAARPFLTAELADRYYGYLDEYDAVITAQPVTDSLGREGEPVTDRREYYLIQAPEAFRFDLLYRHFSAGSPVTATVQQLPSGSRIKRYYDFRYNMKITYQEDFAIAEQLMKIRAGGHGS